jgi:excisionase family DNA binding protein
MKLTIKQVAEREGVSPSLVYQWCEDRLLIHYRYGRKGKRGRILIEESDLVAFIAACRVTPDASLPEGLRHIRQPS